MDFSSIIIKRKEKYKEIELGNNVFILILLIVIFSTYIYIQIMIAGSFYNASKQVFYLSLLFIFFYLAFVPFKTIIKYDFSNLKILIKKQMPFFLGKTIQIQKTKNLYMVYEKGVPFTIFTDLYSCYFVDNSVQPAIKQNLISELVYFSRGFKKGFTIDELNKISKELEIELKSNEELKKQ